MNPSTAAWSRSQTIGVLDSGVGGLTVVKELEQLLPGEEIVYYGDNAHCPYGNRTADDIVEITRGLLTFLGRQNIKLVVLACNTTSSLLYRIAPHFPFPIFSIIAPVAAALAAESPPAVGVIATELTIRTGCYERLIHQHNPAVAVYSEASHYLAGLVDRGDFDLVEIRAEVRACVGALRAQAPVEQIIYGCTHYPIVDEVFREVAPGVRFINPAQAQALAVRRYLQENDLLSNAESHGIKLYTTGGIPVYESVLKRLEIYAPVHFEQIESEQNKGKL